MDSKDVVLIAVSIIAVYGSFIRGIIEYRSRNQK